VLASGTQEKDSRSNIADLGDATPSIIAHGIMSSFCRVTPSTDLRNPCLVPFRGQAEVKGSPVRKHIDQNERSDLELPQDSECLGTRKHAVARLSALDRRVLVDAEHRSDWKWLADNPDVSGLEHDNEGERSARIAAGLPERDGNRAVWSAGARGGVAFSDPLVRSVLLPFGRP